MRSLVALGQLEFLRKIAEARELALEGELHRADRTMALLADDHLGLARHSHHLRLPIAELRCSLARLLPLDIVFLTEHEHDNVGVLLDRARFTQIRELRPLVLALLHLTRELRKRNDRN